MFAIIYSNATGRIRWIMKPDNDSELDLIILKDGEACLKLDDSQYNVLPVLQELINTVTGLTPTDDRYVVVNKAGDVVGTILADPLCGDAVENHELIKHQDAGVGWKVDKRKGLVDARPVVNDILKQTDV